MKLFLLAVALVVATPATAQFRTHFAASCADRQTILGAMATKFAEELRVQGLDTRGTVFELYANEDTGTWTATYTNAQGIMCVLGVGEGGLDFITGLNHGPDF